MSKSQWHRLLEKKCDRREVIRAAITAGVSLALPLNLRCVSGSPRTKALPFSPISTSRADELILPRGFRYDIVAQWGDDIGSGEFGFNNDYIAYFPADLLRAGFDREAPHRGFSPRNASSREGLLFVNHEYVDPTFVSLYSGSGPKRREQLDAEEKAVGFAVIGVTRGSDGRWSLSSDRSKNRRIDARSPLLMTGPAASLDGGPAAIGSLANCSGGATPWGTALSCEENFPDYPNPAPRGWGWDPELYSKRHYGWVVEVDPFDPQSVPRKHTAMGRFQHENVAIRVGRDGTVVAYMGDDKIDSCVYKFVADRRLSDDRAANMRILETGRLFAADFANGRWLLVDYDRAAMLREAKGPSGQPLFSSQAEVLADARAAALALKATPVDRPEDLEIHPLDGSVFISLTNNQSHGNFHGQIVRLVERSDDPTALEFEWSLFAVGGSQSGFSSPDNLIFDAEGNLWMATDVTTRGIAQGIYGFQGNNSMFFFRTSGPDAGKAYQFASGPNDCELAGPAWTPDGSTLFLSVQHPGERTRTLDALTSHWPRGGSEIPRPSVVAITGF